MKFRRLFLVFVIAPCFAKVPIRVAANPYELARYLDRHPGGSWCELNAVLRTLNPRAEPCGDSNREATMGAAEMITVADPDQVILVVEPTFGAHDIYLRYRHQKDGTWRWAGAYRAYIRNYPRVHETHRVAGIPVMRLNVQGTHGSGIGENLGEWFDLSQPGFQPAFRFPVEYYEDGLVMGFSRTQNSEVSWQRRDEIHVTLRIEVSLFNRTVGDFQLDADYHRQPGNAKFQIAAVAPASKGNVLLSPAEFESLAGLDDVTDPEPALLRLCLNELRKVASGRPGRPKETLRRILSRVRTGPEARELRSLLASSVK